jgi:hypothetical protein
VGEAVRVRRARAALAASWTRRRSAPAAHHGRDGGGVGALTRATLPFGSRRGGESTPFLDSFRTSRQSPFVKRMSFQAELLTGHKGDAVILPFDPTRVWGVRLTRMQTTHGERLGHLVKGSLNGHRFEGWLGYRWGRYFIPVDEALAAAANVFAGEIVDVTVEPQLEPEPGDADTARDTSAGTAKKKRAPKRK